MTPISSCLFVNERESTDLPLLCPGPAQPAFYWLLLWLRFPRRGAVSAPRHLCPVRHSQLNQAVKRLLLGRHSRSILLVATRTVPQAGSNQVQIPSHPLAGWPCRGRPGQQSFFRPARLGPRRSAALAASLRLRLHSCAPPRWPVGALALPAARAAASHGLRLHSPRSRPQSGYPGRVTPAASIAAPARFPPAGRGLHGPHSTTPRTLQRLALAGASHSP